MKHAAFLISFLIVGIQTYAAEPTYVASVANPNDYTLFATSGWDGNWYVGYDTCWIKKLPAIPAGDYSRAFIGARLGRMKLSGEGKTMWEKKPLPGEIYMALASTPIWSPESHVALTSTEQIPLEGDYETALEGTGESQWFWVEVPISSVNVKGDNYLALWSPTPELITISSSPVLAAAWGSRSQDTWLLRNIQGTPPQTSGPIGDSISYFDPAMALKLIPRDSSHPLKVQIAHWSNGIGERPRAVITARVEGDSIEKIWLEYFVESKNIWVRTGRTLYHPPFILSLDPMQLPHGRLQLRVVASNVWEERGESSAFKINVSTSTL